MQYIWVVLLFLPSTLSQSGGRFRLVVPEAHVFSVPGSDVVLSCSVREYDRLNILVNAVDLTVTWSRSDLNDSLVHLYGNHKDLNTDQNPSYRGRTAVFKEQLKNGDASLKLSNVRITDEGEYTCRVDSKNIWRTDKTIKLSVEVVGSEPVITMEKYESGKFSLLCESKGWRPEPELQWRNSKGVKLTAETEPQRVADFFNVKSRITVEEIDSYYCTVTQRHHVKEGLINARTLYEHVPSEVVKTVGITIGVLFLVGVLAGVLAGVIYIYNEKKKREEINKEKRKREEEINEVKLLLNSDGDGRLQHHNLSQRQWDHVEETLLKSKEDLEEFNLRKFDPSDRGVEKLKKVIASSKKAVLKQFNLTEKSCEVLASVLKSENSLTDLDLSLNKLIQDSGVKKLCEGLKNSHCKLQNLRLEGCDLSEGSCEHLAKVLQSENSKLIELNLSKNRGLGDLGVEKLRYGLMNKNCKLKILRLEGCDLTEGSCEHLAEVLRSENSKLIELNLSKNRELKDLGVEKLHYGLMNKNCKLKILRLEDCDLREKSCAVLTEVLQSLNSTLIELNLSQNPGVKSGVQKLCYGLKHQKCKLEILRLEDCDLTEESCKDLAKVLRSGNCKLMELNLSKNKKLEYSGVEKLCCGLRSKICKLQKLRLEDCGLSEGSCEHLAEVLRSEDSKLKELNLSQNKGLKDSGVKILCDGLMNKNCKLKILSLEGCDLREESCADLILVLRSENSKLKELNLSQNRGLGDSGVEILWYGLQNKNCKLKILRLAECSIKKEGFTALASALITNPSSPLEELDLSRNELEESELELLPELKDTFPKLKVKLDKCRIKNEGFSAPASENPSSHLSGNGKRESEQKPNDTLPNLNVKLDECSITDEGCADLPSALNPSSPLKELDPKDNELEESKQKLLTHDTFV
ncbi:selection and upkeep of intraepithelial T-cells protein 5-like [Astyanax mexicanus]|uniref:selection and upkeep of intraepithelial T-cells protein 5-like n=1 Tax=Astyanax mexicanus TaxID=7994 RepID=UPI0020CAD70F|nr:selection and upkeep of intraepithelial T-cells protein 5-like [Astyanax mexicanus]XP_049319142.1 selection and upkeep of intraepithelial T-cells protein 5-like [Astyanax mexicanus]XP_049319143.1 selection and upkeep of intraepithelial T-cells protein 5-like [Astyanax mexicanus]